MDFEYRIFDKTINTSIEKKNSLYEISIENEKILVHPLLQLQHLILFKKNEIKQKVYFAKNDNVLYINMAGKQFIVEDLSDLKQSQNNREQVSGESETEICSPMPGKILKILVKEGDEVDIGQNLVIVEAMKMENNVGSQTKGIVKKINFEEGDMINTGQPVIELEPL